MPPHEGRLMLKVPSRGRLSQDEARSFKKKCELNVSAHQKVQRRGDSGDCRAIELLIECRHADQIGGRAGALVQRSPGDWD